MPSTIKILKLPRIEDPRGNLSFIEAGAKGVCPFEIERVYWIYDVPALKIRHGRALAHTDELIVSMSGSFDIAFVDCSEEQTISLNRSDVGVVIPHGTWRELRNFSTNAVAMVLASAPYDPDEYIYDICENMPSGCQDVAPIQLLHEAALPPIDTHCSSNVDDCRIIELPRNRHENGSLTVAQNGAENIPFDIRRAFYLYDVPADSNRGGHSHRQAFELMIALSGSFDVVLDDGRKSKRFSLNRPYKALYITTGLWRTLDNFSGGSVCLVLTSERYSEADYVRDYDRFKLLTKEKVWQK